MSKSSEPSRLGIGTYRMRDQYASHGEALTYALESGIHLIDTASNYGRGDSERMIGNVLKANPELKERAFVISKAGYIPSDLSQDTELGHFLNQRSKDLQIAEITENFHYSLDPEFISFRFDQSLKRLQLKTIDCYLIHNPERLLESKNLNDLEYLYNNLGEIFQFFEQQVAHGRLRYYGISSNTIASPNSLLGIDFRRICELLKKIPNHNFKFLQFPFNFKETEASQKLYEGHSLLELAASNNIRTIGNRPLLMNDNGREFRLVDFPELFNREIHNEVERAYSEFCETLDACLFELTDGENTSKDFEPMRLLGSMLNRFESPIAVGGFIHGQLKPFVLTISEHCNKGLNKQLESLEQLMILSAKKNQSLKAREYLHILKEQGVEIKANLSQTAANHYLNDSGLDHILFGLRQISYIDDLLGR